MFREVELRLIEDEVRFCAVISGEDDSGLVMLHRKTFSNG